MIDIENVINRVTSIPLNQRINRRTMIGTSIGGVLLMSSNAQAQVEIEPPRSPNNPHNNLTSEQIAAQYYRQNLEKKYGFSLLLIKDYIKKAPDFVRLGEAVELQEWTLEQLSMLDDFYAVLPQTFPHP